MKTITVSRAKEALAGWDGMVEVSFHKIGEAEINSIAYSDIESAVSYFNKLVTWYENNKLGGHIAILSKTWMEEPEDGYSSWKSEPVIVRIVGIGKLCTRRTCLDTDCDTESITCSECGEITRDTLFWVDVDGGKTVKGHRPRFCSNCGAKVVDNGA